MGGNRREWEREEKEERGEGEWRKGGGRLRHGI